MDVVKFVVIYLTLYRPGDVVGGGYLPIGRVGVGGADVAGGAEYFAHVFGEVEAVGVPGTVFLDGERAGSDGLGGVPRDHPQGGVIGAGEVATSLRGVAALAWQAGITGSSHHSGQSLRWRMVWGDSAGATNDLFEHTAAHEVIVAFHGEEIPLFIHAGEVRRAICSIVVECPISRFCPDVELVAVFIKYRGEYFLYNLKKILLRFQKNAILTSNLNTDQKLL